MKSLDCPSSFELHRMAGYSKKIDERSSVIEEYILSPELTSVESGTGYSCVFDWTRMSYTFISPSIETILGYSRELFLNEGLNFAFSIIHPADVQKLKEIHAAIFKYYYNTTANLRSKLRFSYNFRVKRADNVYIHILRQSTFNSCDGHGKPATEIINSTDITGYKLSTDISLIIHSLSEKGIYDLCHEHSFSESSTFLSSREKQILELIKKGNTTKDIAGKLYLSAETVKSHRKHIIAKTGAVNMTAAINMIVNHSTFG